MEMLKCCGVKCCGVKCCGVKCCGNVEVLWECCGSVVEVLWNVLWSLCCSEVLWKCCGPLLLSSAVECCWLEVLWSVLGWKCCRVARSGLAVERSEVSKMM